MTDLMLRYYPPHLGDAIMNLCPQASFNCTKDLLNAFASPVYEDFEFLSEEYPTKEEAELELIRLVNAWQSVEYKRLRAPEYPPIGDQLDALYHAGVFPEDMAEQIAAVKEKYPKPE